MNSLILPVGATLMATAMAQTSPALALAIQSPRFQLSIDERFALLDGAEGVVLIDLTAAATVPLPAGGPWHAGSFGGNGDRLWLVDDMGTARGFALDGGTAPPVALANVSPIEIGVPKVDDVAGPPPRFHDLALAGDGAHLAWSMTAGGERRAGVHAVATGAEVVRFADVDPATTADDEQPWIGFLGTGTHVVVHERARRRDAAVAGPGLLVWELATRRAVARFAPYAALRTPGHAALADGLVFGIRNDTRRWSLVRWRPTEPEPREILHDARGGHFLDLHPEPGGRVLCEWDFEHDDGIVVVDPDHDRPPRTVAPGHAFVGFATGPVEALSVLARSPEGTLRRFSWRDGTRQGEIALDPTFEVTAARWSLRQGRLLAIGTAKTAGGGSLQAHVVVAPSIGR